MVSLPLFNLPGTNTPTSYAELEMRRAIALGLMKQKRGYPKNLGEGLSAIGESIGEIGLMRQLAAQERELQEARRKEGQTDEDLAKAKTPVMGYGAELSDDEFDAQVNARPGTAIVNRPVQQAVQDIEEPLQPPPDLNPDPNRRVVIQTPSQTPPPPQLGPQQVAPTEAPIATVQPRSLQPPPGPAAQAAAMSPSQNPLLNQYPIEPPENAPFPGPDVASQQVPESVAMRQPPQAPMPQGGTAPQDQAWFPQTVANLRRTVGPQPIGGSPGLTGTPQPPGQQAMAEPPQGDSGQPPDYRTDIAMSLAQRGPGGPPPNPMMGGVSPAAMPQNLMSGGGLPMPPDLSLAGSPPESAGNRPIVMSDVNPMPLAPGMQLAQAATGAPTSTPPAPRPTPPPGLKPSSAPLEPVTPPAQVPGRRQDIVPKAPPRPEDVPYDPRYQALRKRLREAEIFGDPVRIKSVQDAMKPFEESRAREAAERLKVWEKQLEHENTQRNSELEYQRGEAIRNLQIQEGERKAEEAKHEARVKQATGVPEAIYLKGLEKGVEDTKNIPAATHSIKTIRNLLTGDNRMFTGGSAEVDLSIAKLATSLGWPENPRISRTEQFKTAIAPIVAQARQAIIGGGNYSDADRTAVENAAAGKITLSRDAILATMDALERVNRTGALHHQSKVERYAKAFGPDGQAAVFDAFGVPNIEALVPPASIEKLTRFGADPQLGAQVMKDFDATYHTPGLAARILSRR